MCVCVSYTYRVYTHIHTIFIIHINTQINVTIMSLNSVHPCYNGLYLSLLQNGMRHSCVYWNETGNHFVKLHDLYCNCINARQLMQSI